MWESEQFAELAPLSIPHHGKKDLPKPTRDSILNQLEEDLLEWEQYLESNDGD